MMVHLITLLLLLVADIQVDISSLCLVFQLLLGILQPLQSISIPACALGP